MMASEDKKSKAVPAPKRDPSKDKATSDATPTKAGDVTPTKAESSRTAAAPPTYIRGEGQKPVSQSYRDNWNAIYGKKKKKR